MKCLMISRMLSKKSNLLLHSSSFTAPSLSVDVPTGHSIQVSFVGWGLGWYWPKSQIVQGSSLFGSVLYASFTIYPAVQFAERDEIFGAYIKEYRILKRKFYTCPADLSNNLLIHHSSNTGKHKWKQHQPKLQASIVVAPSNWVIGKVSGQGIQSSKYLSFGSSSALYVWWGQISQELTFWAFVMM